MKIIAKTDNGFLLEAIPSEILSLMGHDSFSELPTSRMIIGFELEIQKMVDTSKFVRTLDQNKLKATRERLASAISEIDSAIETAQALSLFETIKDA